MLEIFLRILLWPGQAAFFAALSIPFVVGAAMLLRMDPLIDAAFYLGCGLAAWGSSVAIMFFVKTSLAERASRRDAWDGNADRRRGE
jgi:hypothetical protein